MNSVLGNVKKILLVLILSPADPLRPIVCQWAKQAGLAVECFNDLYDAISRISIKPQFGEYFILSRPFAFDWQTAEVLKTILGGENTQFVIWAKNGFAMPQAMTIGVHHLGDLARIFKTAAHSDIQKKDTFSERIKNWAQLTDEELTLLLGTHYETE